jgi:hypothetical protein
MKKPKIVVDLLIVTDIYSRPQRLELSSLTHVTRGLQRRSSRKIRRYAQQIEGIVSSNPLSRKRKDHSIDLPMLRNGARSITHGMIWKSARLF